MTSGAEGEWVRQGTPRDDNADWNEEPSEYGSAVSPTEWDDYSTEQSVPVAAPRPPSAEGAATASSADSPAERESEPVPGQEPDSEREYRAEESDDDREGAPVGDPDDSGMEPERLDDVGSSDAPAFVEAPTSPVEVGQTWEGPSHDDVQDSAGGVQSSAEDVQVFADDVDGSGDVESPRPRPMIPDAPSAAVEAAEPVDVDEVQSRDANANAEQGVDDGNRTDAAEFLTVDPMDAPVEHAESPSVADERNDEPVQAANPSDQPDEVPVVVAPVGDVEESVSPDTSDDEATTVVETDDMEATQAVPVFAAAAPAVAGATATNAVPAGLYRADDAEHTSVIEPPAESYPDVDVEEERLQARLEAERQARDQRLGAVPTSSNNAIREDSRPLRITTDRFLPSLGLFVLRLVTAAILGVTSWQILGSGVDKTANFLGGYSLIPEPRLVAWILGFTLGALALLLVIGLLQRVVGFVLLAVAVAALTLIRWGNFSIFDADVAGFMGDKDLLLAAVGLLLLAMGGGKWGIDGAFRGARAASKAEREN